MPVQLVSLLVPFDGSIHSVELLLERTVGGHLGGKLIVVPGDKGDLCTIRFTWDTNESYGPKLVYAVSGQQKCLARKAIEFVKVVIAQWKATNPTPNTTRVPKVAGHLRRPCLAKSKSGKLRVRAASSVNECELVGARKSVITSSAAELTALAKAWGTMHKPDKHAFADYLTMAFEHQELLPFQ